MENSHTSVLVVGAGPTGLLMACELARYGVSFRIIDKKSEPTLTSNAAGIQTRTIELFADIGIATPFIEEGVHCQHMNFRYHGKLLLQFDMSAIDSIYKYILLMPQAETERILTERLEELGGKIERETEFIEYVETDLGVEVRLEDQEGRQENVICDWLIGCDGAHSVVRSCSGIEFPGEDIKEQFIVADGEMSTHYPADEINVFANDGIVLGAFPLGKNRYRLAANLLKPVKSNMLENEYIARLVNERCANEVEVKSIHWASPFWIHSKMARDMRKGRVFLAGDAAHIHSPVGGQGMNTGLQDVYNLAWKLAFVIQGKAKESLLDSYQVERQQVIKKIVDTSEALTNLMISTSQLKILMRNLIMKLINTQAWLKKKICLRITQLDIEYRDVGKRFRDVILSNGKHLHDYLDKKKFNIVISGDMKVDMDKQYPDLVNVVYMKEYFYGDETENCYVVRPDMYVCKNGVKDIRELSAQN